MSVVRIEAAYFCLPPPTRPRRHDHLSAIIIRSPGIRASCTEACEDQKLSGDLGSRDCASRRPLCARLGLATDIRVSWLHTINPLLQPCLPLFTSLMSYLCRGEAFFTAGEAPISTVGGIVGLSITMI